MQHFAPGHVNRVDAFQPEALITSTTHCCLQTTEQHSCVIQIKCHPHSVCPVYSLVSAEVDFTKHFPRRCMQMWVWVCGRILAPTFSSQVFLNVHQLSCVMVFKWTGLCVIHRYSDGREGLLHLKFRVASCFTLWNFTVYPWFNWSFSIHSWTAALKYFMHRTVHNLQYTHTHTQYQRV